MKMHQSIFNKMMTYFYCLTIVSILSLNHRCGANIDFHLDVIEANLSNTNRNILIKKTIGEELSESRSEDDVSVSADDIRCYCNLPKCVTTGYMCRTSRTGGCFTELNEISNNKLPTRRGCFELLQNENAMVETENARRHYKGNRKDVLVTQCNTDMCNHVKDDEPVNRRGNSKTHHEEDLIRISSSEDNELEKGPAPKGDVINIVFTVTVLALTVVGVGVIFILIRWAINIIRDGNPEKGPIGGFQDNTRRHGDLEANFNTKENLFKKPPKAHFTYSNDDADKKLLSPALYNQIHETTSSDTKNMNQAKLNGFCRLPDTTKTTKNTNLNYTPPTMHQMSPQFNNKLYDKETI